MNILIYGAGVIGSVYAVRLQEAGHQVSLLARGQRAISLRKQGVILEDALTGYQTATRVGIVDHLTPMDYYDVVIVTVRLDQLASILPILAANRQIPTMLFLLNNPAGMQRFEMLESHRVVLGFPSVGGMRQGEVIRYILPRQVPTTLGKEDGHLTPRIRELRTAFKEAGFSVALNSDMQAWLKVHAIIVVCIIAAVIMTKGTSAQLGQRRQHVVMMVQAIREGLLALQAQAIPITPLSMKVLFLWMPRWLVVIIGQYILRTPAAALGVDPHVVTDIDEIRQMAREIMAYVQVSPLSTPTLNRLIAFLEIPA